MDFSFSDDQRAIIDLAHDFGQSAIAPYALDWDQQGTMPREVLSAAAELGLAAIYTPEDKGGTGLGRLDAVLIFEELSKACPSIAAFLSIHNMVVNMVATLGTDEQIDQWLPGLISMQTVASYCLTEPGSGSDAAALKTRADRTNEGWTLNGTKSFISGGGYSDLYLSMVRTGQDGPKGVSALLVPNGTDGLSFGKNEVKMGWRAQPTSEVRFQDCKVGAEALLGEEGQGFVYAMQGLDGGRLNIAACALGGAQAALDAALRYAGERQAFGGPIDRFQSLQFRLADMETDLQAARVFLHQAAWHYDQGSADATKRCAMAKRLVTDVAFRVANDALQIHGGYGYLADYGIEKIVRDLRVHQILEGTNEIMRLIIARDMLKARG
ncbi:acyl-CoA dehydrogenase family protein [Halovulum sp. GXIMD14793]